MKARRPNTDQEAEFRIFADGRQLAEYKMPLHDTENDNIVECFVPVVPGDELRIIGTFSGSILHGAFDLVADGAFVWDTRIEGKTGVKLHKNKKVEHLSAFNNPRIEGWTSIEEPPTIVEGNLHVRQMTQADRSALSKHEIPEVRRATLGVGSLALIVSVNQETRDMHEDKQYWKMRLRAWRERESTIVRDTGIEPEHQLEIKVTNPDEPVSAKRAAKHRRHYGQTRFGSKPWAKFVFHYRSQEAIDEIGCTLRAKDEVQELGEGDLANFRFAERVAGPAGRRKDAVVDEESEPQPAKTMPVKKPRLGGILDLSGTGSIERPLQNPKPRVSDDLLFGVPATISGVGERGNVVKDKQKRPRSSSESPASQPGGERKAALLKSLEEKKARNRALQEKKRQHDLAIEEKKRQREKERKEREEKLAREREEEDERLLEEEIAREDAKFDELEREMGGDKESSEDSKFDEVEREMEEDAESSDE